mmetsp:Transcript_50364/g.163011  ORF Transcript_50364/g.163011 Transcript_50364/m.163011 type:complete len:208 (+) Transcript_50364:465-1088(+)
MNFQFMRLSLDPTNSAHSALCIGVSMPAARGKLIQDMKPLWRSSSTSSRGSLPDPRASAPTMPAASTPSQTSSTTSPPPPLRSASAPGDLTSSAPPSSPARLAAPSAVRAADGLAPAARARALARASATCLASSIHNSTGRNTSGAQRSKICPEPAASKSSSASASSSPSPCLAASCAVARADSFRGASSRAATASRRAARHAPRTS